jgi:hypothetical protein
MLFNTQFMAERGRNLSLRIDDIGDAPHVADQDPFRVVGGGEGSFRICNQRKTQRQRSGELGLPVQGFVADADDLDVLRPQFLPYGLEPARLQRSTRSERLWKKIEYHPSPSIITERDH